MKLLVRWLTFLLSISYVLGQQLYSIGNPSAEAQLLLTYINRARANPDVAEMLAGLVPGTLTVFPPVEPVAFNSELQVAASMHSVYQKVHQIVTDKEDPQINSSAFYGASVGDRAERAGYSWYSLAENVGNGANIPAIYSTLLQRIEYRSNLMEGDNNEIGIGVEKDSLLWVTELYGNEMVDRSFIAGVVFNDSNDDGLYTIGEGCGGVNVQCNSTVGGVRYYAITTSAGSFTLPIPKTSTGSVSCTAAVSPARNISRSFNLKGSNHAWEVLTNLIPGAPTRAPTKAPSKAPTKAPTPSPTAQPTLSPTQQPTHNKNETGSDSSDSKKNAYRAPAIALPMLFSVLALILLALK